MLPRFHIRKRLYGHRHQSVDTKTKIITATIGRFEKRRSSFENCAKLHAQVLYQHTRSDMLRIFTTDSPGWHEFRSNKNKIEFLHHISYHCHELNSVVVGLHKTFTHYEFESQRKNTKTRTRFCFEKIRQREITAAEDLDITYSYGSEYENDKQRLFIEEGSCQGTLIDTDHGTSMVQVTACQKVGKMHHVIFGESHAVTFTCQCHVRLVTMHLSVPNTSFRAMFVYNQNCRSTVNPIASSPTCVNACYTSDVSEKIHCTGEIERFRVVNGSCGIEFSFPSILGKANVYRPKDKRRKVTFKAYTELSSVVMALQRIRDITGCEYHGPIYMHMLVYESKTGYGMDTSVGGFVQAYLTSAFRDTNMIFTSQMDEVNVHCLVEWDNLWVLFNFVFPHDLVEASNADDMKKIHLTMSITRLGTIIFRISMSQKKNTTKPVEYSVTLQDKIITVINKLHFLISTYSMP